MATTDRTVEMRTAHESDKEIMKDERFLKRKWVGGEKEVGRSLRVTSLLPLTEVLLITFPFHLNPLLILLPIPSICGNHFLEILKICKKVETISFPSVKSFHGNE